LHASLRMLAERRARCAVRGRVLPVHREALEERIYEDGFMHLRELLCTDLARACSGHGHELFDSGEL